jgi:hypothetical protein
MGLSGLAAGAAFILFNPPMDVVALMGQVLARR